MLGNNSEADNQVVGQSFAIEANDTEDVWVFMSTGTGEIFSVKVSVEVCSEVSLEDRRADLLVDFEEALTKTMVGMYRLTKKMHLQEYKGTLRLTDRGVVVEP